MIDPRLFLMINGPQSQPVQLVPGFHPPGSGPSAPLLQPPQMQQPQIPGFGLGLSSPWTPTSGGANPGMPTANGDPTGGSGPAYLGGASALGNPMQAVDPSSLAAAPGGGGFFNFLRGLF